MCHAQLTNGVLVSVPSVLIKKLKQHFVNLDCDVGCIIGNNGCIGVTERLVDMEGSSINSTSSAETDRKKKQFEEKVIDPETRKRIARVVQCINSLKCASVGCVTCRKQWKMISPEAIMALYHTL